MAYGSNYGAFPYYPQTMMQAPQYSQPIAQQSTDERIWVQSEQAAEAYLVAPSSFVRLWDSNRPIFYEKRADATGKPFPMEVYEYSRKSAEGSNSALLTAQPTIDYSEQIKALDERLSALEGAKKGAKNAKSNADDSSI